jgi:integrase/recombinase XerD
MNDKTDTIHREEDSQQLPLFPELEKTSATTQTEDYAQDTSPDSLHPQTPLNAAIDAFEAYMQARGFTENTQQAFRLDMGILADYVGGSTAVAKVDTATLNAFLTWMQGPRDVPCSPKTLERRITTLKVFFGWLADDEILPRDPAAPLIHHSVTAPLPETLDDAQRDAILATTQRIRHGDEERKADARPHLLVTLILHTGIKKSECVNIQLPHIDLTNPERPALWIRYRQPRRQYKERRILLPTRWPTILREYREQYNPRQALFPWTARNLEYVLTGVATEADVPRLTFEMLRWTCAVRDYLEGMKSEALRQKLGLSEISWYEVEPKLALLAQQIKH